MEPSLPPFQSLPPPSAGRRLPPPCWSHEETVALIDSYRDKWYSLRRGNLRALHWQDVADAVAALCPHSSPPKTSLQCRHKMEKLRKRYRSELQRATSIPNHRFSSAWVYFNKMDHMEKGTSPVKSDELVDFDPNGYQYSVNDFHGSISNGSGVMSEPGSGARHYSIQNLKQGNEVNGLVPAIKMLGEGFVKMEKMKMDMMRQIEQNRMEMEMKRTEMILESQQLLVDALVKGISDTVKNTKGRSPQKS